jgi:adenosylcobinamide-phosphate guanylyltransferase
VLALIMAGGKGTRLQMGEKGLVRLCEKPLIEYVLSALDKAGLEILVVTTPQTPYTSNYCRVRGLDQVCTSGIGYVEDIIEATRLLEEDGPVLIICADIPGITSELLCRIISMYHDGGTESGSVWVPESLFTEYGCTPRYITQVDGIPAVPAGINILLGEKIEHEQSETRILIHDPALIFNINTRSELITAQSFFSRNM